jgi:multidrug resistance efflux pump
MAKNTFEIIYDATNSAYSALEKSVSSTIFSENTIDNYKNTISGKSSASKSSLNNIINNIDKINNLTNLDNTKNNYAQSVQDYNIKIQSKENELTNLEKSVTIQQEIYWDVKNGSSYERIAQAQNGVTQKKLSLENVKRSLDNLRLEASFDGIVRKIDFKV